MTVLGDSSVDRQKVALVTGASSGIGYACTIELASRGYLVFAGARRLEPMDLLKDYGIIPIQLDVSDAKSVGNAKNLIMEHTGHHYLDILYNNAGQSCTFPAIDVTDEAMRQCYEVNVFGAVRTTRTFIPMLINARGLVAFTGSVTGIISFPWLSTYAGTKAAIAAYAATLRLELKPFHVDVVNIVTGGVNTNIEDTRSLPDLSLYNVPGMQEAFKYRQQMSRRNNPMDAAVFAKQVVSDFENVKFSHKLEYYRGTKALLLYWISRLVPRAWLEWGIIRKFHLQSVFDALERKYSQVKKLI